MARTRIKVCGITDEASAAAAAQAGADAVGFVFAKSSPRRVEPARAWVIAGAAPPFVATVAVFQGASLDEILEVESVCPTDFTQLHGDEDVETARRCGPRAIKAIPFDAATIAERLETWSAVEEIDAVLVDGPCAGAGEAIDWDALASAKPRCAKPLILAGGLTPGNVAQAVRTVRPYAVDVSSGVERERGVKDADLIHAFCAAVRGADQAID